MPEIRQIRLSGFGGQGIVLIGALLGHAAVLEGRFASASNAYGAQARGAWCKSEIVLSDAPIDFPHVTTADMLVVMSQNAYAMYCEDVRETGLILYDKGLITPKENLKVKQVGVPATQYAVKKLNSQQVANLVLLGVLIEYTRLVSPKAVRKAIGLTMSERFRTLNLNAFQAGLALGRQIRG